MNATIAQNEIPVSHSVRPDVGREYLTIDVPNGWDDVKKISKKVLVFDGRKFTFTGWNSDTLKCYFCRPLVGEIQTATIKNR